MIVFYISGHGFGHASREVEIINQLGWAAPILIRTAVSPNLLARTVRVPYDLLPGPCDTGVVQTTSVSHDDDATVRAALEFHRTFDHRVEHEVRQLAATGVRLVVGDIPPLAFATAARLGVPAVAISNFTWDWIYETHPGFLPAGRDVLAQIRACYRSATLALELPMSGGFEIFPAVEQLPFVARRPTQPRAATRAHFGLPAHGRVALMSFGGYGLASLDLSRVDCRDTWTIVTTDSVSRDVPVPPGIRLVTEQAFLDSAFRYEDLIAAVDVVVTKPGYGIIAECVSAGTAMLYTSRGAFRESQVLIDALPGLVQSWFISQEDLFAGRWRAALEALVDQPAPPGRVRTDGAEVAGHRLREVFERTARPSSRS